MADELAIKLSRRIQIEEGAEDPVAVDVPGHQNGSEDKPSTASADAELGALLMRREGLNEGLGEPCQPSMKVFNPYTEFKEFSRNQIRDMEKLFKTEFEKNSLTKDITRKDAEKAVPKWLIGARDRGCNRAMRAHGEEQNRENQKTLKLLRD